MILLVRCRATLKHAPSSRRSEELFKGDPWCRDLMSRLDKITPTLSLRHVSIYTV